MDRRQLAEEELKKLFQSVIEDSRKHPPKVIRPQCNDCKNRVPGSLNCKVYPEGVSKNILSNRETCKEFVQK